MALLTGYHLLGVGVAGFFFVPSSRVWGKRHAFLIGTVFLVFSSAWAGSVGKNYHSLLAARVFQGIGLAPFEALVNAAVGDLYFVHERGKRMALTNFAVFGGSFMTPVIVGKMTHSIGWKWSFYFVAIFTGMMLPVIIFFLPETAYRRPKHLETDISQLIETHRHSIISENGHGDLAAHKETGTNAEIGGRGDLAAQKEYGRSMEIEQPKEPPPKMGYWESIYPINGRKTDETFWKLLLRPFPLFLHPGILWACLIQGTLIGWTVFLGIVLAAIMLGPPLFFNEVQTGYMYTGAFIGAVVGFLIAGLTADPVTSYLTRLNRGVYEPEFRLFLVIPQLILGCAGLFGFGITSNNTYRYGWFWPDFFFALEVAGMVVGAVASACYIVDAHRNIAIEAFTCMMIFKNIFSFGLTWSGYDWLVQSGIKPVFMASGIVQVVVCCTTIPLCKFHGPLTGSCLA
jgi:Major Facilitator Superfamily